MVTARAALGGLRVYATTFRVVEFGGVTQGSDRRRRTVATLGCNAQPLRGNGGGTEEEMTRGCVNESGGALQTLAEERIGNFSRQEAKKSENG